MSRRLLPVGIFAGLVWGALAVLTFLAMFSDRIPAPGDLPLPLAIGVVLVCVPFYAAIALEAGLGRASPTIFEVGMLGIACGAVLGVATSWLVVRARSAPRPIAG